MNDWHDIKGRRVSMLLFLWLPLCRHMFNYPLYYFALNMNKCTVVKGPTWWATFASNMKYGAKGTNLTQHAPVNRRGGAFGRWWTVCVQFCFSAHFKTITVIELHIKKIALWWPKTKQQKAWWCQPFVGWREKIGCAVWMGGMALLSHLSTRATFICDHLRVLKKVKSLMTIGEGV